MTAIQVSDKGFADIMQLPCVAECYKEKNLRYTFILRNEVKAEEGDWIINAESSDNCFVLSDKHFQMVKQAIEGNSKKATLYSAEEIEKIIDNAL